MTDFDKKLIEKANGLRRWDYRMVDALAAVADTREARDELSRIRWELYDSILETI